MLKRFYDFISGAGTLWGFLPTMVTTSITASLWLVAMAVVGYLQSIPIFWIMTGLPIAAAASFTTFLRASEWRERNTAANKLVFAGVLLAADYNKDDSGKPISLERAQVTLMFQTAARFSIAFIVEEFSSSFEGEYPPSKPRDADRSVASPGELRTFADNKIEMKGAALKEIVTGTVRFRLRYGHAGREKYRMSHNLNFEGKFEPKIGGYVVFRHGEIA